jgi:deazaflavin-dependent oxidoreductase (nitroreductase family)
MQVACCYVMKGPQEQIIEAAPQPAAQWRSLDLALRRPALRGPIRRPDHLRNRRPRRPVPKGLRAANVASKRLTTSQQREAYTRKTRDCDTGDRPSEHDQDRLPITNCEPSLGQSNAAYHRGVPIPRIFARFNRTIANPVMRLFAGRLPPFAIITHRGRVSGREYATPVWAFGTRDRLVVALLYGARSDWVQNVLAAGHAQVKRSGETREYSQPRLLRDADMPLIPAIARVPVRLLRTHDLLCLTGPRPN